jgi:NAD(P)H-hydrate repair Nnr-like enzyme with NAD(P)H-hydrate dehydratase domain
MSWARVAGFRLAGAAALAAALAAFAGAGVCAVKSPTNVNITKSTPRIRMLTPLSTHYTKKDNHSDNRSDAEQNPDHEGIRVELQR